MKTQIEAKVNPPFYEPGGRFTKESQDYYTHLGHLQVEDHRYGQGALWLAVINDQILMG